jgi:hypothetical protein
MNLQSTPTECRERTQKKLDLIENKELLGWEWGWGGFGDQNTYINGFLKMHIKMNCAHALDSS